MEGVKIWLSLMRFGRRLGCHQIAERSFFIRGYQFPVCARCTGIFIGQIVSSVLFFFLTIDWLIGLFMLVPMAIDGGLQYINLLKSDNFRRVITGFVGGFGLTYVYGYFIKSIILAIIALF